MCFCACLCAGMSWHSRYLFFLAKAASFLAFRRVVSANVTYESHIGNVTSSVVLAPVFGRGLHSQGLSAWVEASPERCLFICLTTRFERGAPGIGGVFRIVCFRILCRTLLLGHLCCLPVSMHSMHCVFSIHPVNWCYIPLFFFLLSYW